MVRPVIKRSASAIFLVRKKKMPKISAACKCVYPFIVSIMETVSMPKDACDVWRKQYATDMQTVTLKLLMGAESYTRSLQDPTNSVVASFSQLVDRLKIDLNPGNLLPELRALRTSVSTAVKESESGVLRAIENQTQISTAKSKATIKGKVFEGSLHQMLEKSPAFASAHLLAEKDARGKQGGDILVTDHQGNGCVVELKDKVSITEDDLSKFVNDAEYWPGPEKVFAFVKKGGIGSCRKLQIKPLLELTTHGKLLVWFKEDEEQFVEHLPFVLGLAGQLLKTAVQDHRLVHAHKAVDSATKSIGQALADVRSDIGETDKRQLQLKKREKILLSALNNINIVTDDAGGTAEPVTKKLRILDTSIPITL
jgi:hypothetical protein